MMAWVRTATSLITFGFTVYKFFQFELEGSEQADRVLGPRGFGLLMISAGIASLLAATVQHVRGLRALRAECPAARPSVAAALAGFISILGVGALALAVLRR